ncbi:hypothetical protein H257_07278 [Aphanomyces astaci]|uniref:Uncharacterized protein n=1 Tax=Aphanomyces astaci TaxID=112090 RepID=W4GJM1_APHAT|nr:hypothetical protein H257_07278 [Aphanomyces astaci]ETV79209.1 hypothetical protein H257_07278 [Aphanomyces astaci]|eukprot:XP_009831050.1 hypothetical protein H257_07278 [Aphanomyces astaci]
MSSRSARITNNSGNFATTSPSMALYSWCDALAATALRRPAVAVPRPSVSNTRTMHRAGRTSKQVMPPRNALKKQQESMAKSRASSVKGSGGASKSVAYSSIMQQAKLATAFLCVVPKLM